MRYKKSILINESLDPYYNLALEEYLLYHPIAHSVVFLWQNEPTVVVGKHQDVFREVNLRYVNDHKIHIARRITGGGAVYHDMGNLNYTIIYNTKSLENELRTFLDILLNILKEYDIKLKFGGRNDFYIGDLKISGTAQKIQKDMLLFHGSLLFNTDLLELKSSLWVSGSKFHTKYIQSTNSLVGNVVDYLGKEFTLQNFKNMVVDKLIYDEGYKIEYLSPQILCNVERLRNEKYIQDRWIYNKGIFY